MIRVLTRAVLVAALLTGCARTDQAGGAAPGADTTTRRPADSTLAYEHAFSVLLASQDMRPRFEAVRTACIQAERGTCTLLTAELSSGEYTRAKIVARVQPEFVARLVEIASVGGEIQEQTTKAEDLAAPVADTERNLAWLTRHRDRLIAFQDRKDINVEQLIQLSEQIARTQSQIETLTAERGNLQRRIDTDLVTLTLFARWSPQRSVMAPVRDAAAEFVPNFFMALGALMQFVSFLLPWLIILVPLVVGARWVWRRVRQRRNAARS